MRISLKRFIPVLVLTLAAGGVIVLAQAAGSVFGFEAETGVHSGNIAVTNDTQASGGQAVRFTDGSDPAGQRPTRDNTGPRYSLTDMTPAQFWSSRTCNRQRITGDLNFDQSWMRAQTFTLTDCEITGNLWIYIQGGGSQLPVNDMPTISLDYVDVGGGVIGLNAAKLTIDHSYFANGGQITLKDYWAPFINGPAPITVRNTVFYHPPGNAANGDHVEALHIADYGSGWRFTNVAFVQQGPMNGTQTATINFHGSDSVFDGCWFLWEGGTAAYYTVYIDGPNNVVKNSWFAKGQADFVYPGSPTMATYTNNRDVDTGAVIN